MILLILIIFVLAVWFINKLLFGELYKSDDDQNDAPIIIEKPDIPSRKNEEKTIGDFGEYVEFREVEE
ncbi:MAG: hypothetical protein J5595_06835 [Bacteroidales bacterium]|nr:hypothetical protein [Bacteroidales bacterium]